MLLSIIHFPVASNVSLEILEKDSNLKHIRNWLNASEQPTFNQLNQLSKKIEVPLGYLLVNSVQENNSPLLEYRTISNNSIKEPSKALLDTINDMEDKQAYMREFLIRNDYDNLSFVGKFSQADDSSLIIENIRETLQINEKWFENCSQDAALNYLRNKFENAGIVVMKNGIVKTNVHRKLNIDEFRTFVLVDEYAPLIFINNKDSMGAKIFSLFHEVAHIFLGENSLFNDNNIERPRYRNKKLEVLCNNIASELCVSTCCFKELWVQNANKDKFDRVKDIAQNCKVSILSVAVKALKNRYIIEDEYYKIRNYILKLYKDRQEQTRKGGNGIYNAMARIDKPFFRALFNDTRTGNIQYTEAYRLSNTSRTSFDIIEKKILEG